MKPSWSEQEELVQLAKQGEPVAQNILGARLITGDYSNRNDPCEGFYWYCQAIKNGYTHSKWNAGSMLVDGDDGIEKNEAVGMILIEDAAESNENSACLFMSMCYRKGLYGKKRDEKLAVYWNETAWSIAKFQEYGKPIDLEKEYGLKIVKPDDC